MWFEQNVERHLHEVEQAMSKLAGRCLEVERHPNREEPNPSAIIALTVGKQWRALRRLPHEVSTPPSVEAFSELHKPHPFDDD